MIMGNCDSSFVLKKQDLISGGCTYVNSETQRLPTEIVDFSGQEMEKKVKERMENVKKLNDFRLMLN